MKTQTLRKFKLLRYRLQTWHGYNQKLTLNDINEFMEKVPKSGSILNIYCDIPLTHAKVNFEDFKAKGEINRYLDQLSEIESNSYECIIAVGLLEHLPNPNEFINECYRILKHEGCLYLRVSSVFSVHVGPNDFFHYTKYGLLSLFKTDKWLVQEIYGSSPPYKTLAILLQRILLQSRSGFISRLITHALIYYLPKLDKFVIDQFQDTSYDDLKKIESMLPSNINAIVCKK